MKESGKLNSRVSLSGHVLHQGYNVTGFPGTVDDFGQDRFMTQLLAAKGLRKNNINSIHTFGIIE